MGRPCPLAYQDACHARTHTQVPILVARYAGNPVLLEKVEEAVRVQVSAALSKL